MIHEKICENFMNIDGLIDLPLFMDTLEEKGILINDPRIKETVHEIKLLKKSGVKKQMVTI